MNWNDVDEMGMDGLDEPHRGICPVCGGGDSRENSFVVGPSDMGGIWYKCFRASCGIKGIRNAFVVSENERVRTRVPDRPAFEPTDLIPGNWSRIGPNDDNYFCRKYGIDPDVVADHDLFKSSVPGRTSVAFPLNSHTLSPSKHPPYQSALGVSVSGWQTRSSVGLGRKLVHTYKCVDMPQFFIAGIVRSGRHVVVVEDPFSAIKINNATMRPCVAILGCNMSNAQAELLLSVTKKLTFALDPDTWGHSPTPWETFIKKHGANCDRVTALFCPKDPKDMSYNDLEDLFGVGGN